MRTSACFRGKLKNSCRYHSSKNKKIRDRVASRVQLIWKLLCKLTTPGSRGDVTRRCCVVARHVNRENGERTTHFDGQCSFPLIFCSRCNISVLWLFTVTFDELSALWRACKCNMNSIPAWRVTPPWVVYMAKCDPGGQGYPTWQTGQPA